MAEYFHRNPMKATYIMTFEMQGSAGNEAAKNICRKFHQTRNELIELLSDASSQTIVVVATLKKYLGLLQGFVESPDEGERDSKLRHAVVYWWSNTLLTDGFLTYQHDSVYEKASMMFSVGLWLMNHALTVGGKDRESTKMEDEMHVHKCLRVAAGLFNLIRRELICLQKGGVGMPNAADSDPNILDAYSLQCQAEAQEVMISCAIELKRDSSIISSLAHETAKLYRLADAALTSVHDRVCLKWQKYLQFKTEIYYAYAYSYHAETLLAQDKCGEAIKCVKESQTRYKKATQVVEEYSSAKGVGKTAKPQDHLFFLRLGPVIEKTLMRCIHVNSFICHQEVPETTPDLGEKEVYGVATPEEFQMPPTDSMWTIDAYRAFNRKDLRVKHEMYTGGKKPDPEVTLAEDLDAISGRCTVS